ncbi:MAG: 5'-nucleotidase C-terminal domain-containing protein [Christensenellales bacterium]
MKKCMTFLLVLVMLLTFSGCNGDREKEPEKTEKIEITMYLWDKSMTKTLTPWLEEKFPEYKMTFVVGYNTMDYYTDLTGRGEPMPDIITCRRFSINNAVHLSDQLLDLSSTEVVGTFYNSYIENNREEDGGIRWLPMCAEVDGYIANLDLFEQYGIPVPTDYAGFAYALTAFENAGVRGFAGDWSNDYACLELLQGSAIPLLMSREGRNWRVKYESETDENPVGLDDVVWPQVFEKFKTYLHDVHYNKVDYNKESHAYAFQNGNLAIMRGTATDCAGMNSQGINCVMLPYFGETANDNWILTYPMCQLAVAKHVGEDSAKKNAVLRVLNAIFSREGQIGLSSGAAVLTYSQAFNFELGKPFEMIRECIEGNRLYMRLASTEFFSISKTVVRKMLNGEVGYGGSTYGAADGYAEFNSLLKTTTQSEPVVVLTQEEAYSSSFGEHGIPAASSVMNTMRQGTECDISIGYSPLISAPVFSGNYTRQQLTWLLTTKTGGYTAEYTGAEIIRYMEWLINVKEDGSNPVRNYYALPVTSGMEYTIKNNENGKFTLISVTVNGQPIGEETVYKVMILSDDSYITDSAFCNCPIPEDLQNKRTMLSGKNVDILLRCLEVTEQLLAPEQYVTITE